MILQLNLMNKLQKKQNEKEDNLYQLLNQLNDWSEFFVRLMNMIGWQCLGVWTILNERI